MMDAIFFNSPSLDPLPTMRSFNGIPGILFFTRLYALIKISIPYVSSSDLIVPIMISL